MELDDKTELLMTAAAREKDNVGCKESHGAVCTAPDPLGLGYLTG